MEAHLASCVLERDELAVSRAVADARRSLGTARVSRLGRHLSLHHRPHRRRIRRCDTINAK